MVDDPNGEKAHTGPVLQERGGGDIPSLRTLRYVQPVWRIEMLGTLKASHGELSVTRFRTRRVALLLAFLGFYKNRFHFRDELGEMLWPEQDPEVIRRNLRQALSSLRHALEPPAVPKGAIVQVDQARIQLSASLVSTDVSDFENLIERSRRATEGGEQHELLKQAITFYKGELLPGYYEEWIARERLRLEDLYVYSLRRLIERCEADERWDEAIQYARLALAKEPLNEHWHTSLMRLYLGSGRPESALRQFRELSQRLADELGCEPSDVSKQLAAKARKAAPAETSVRDKGSVSAITPDYPAQSPQTPTPNKPHVHLPLQLTRFFGRKIEVERAVEILLRRSSCLLTLLGPAGTGKTRLSVEIGRTLAEEHGWNVWFVGLADISDASMLVDAVLDAMKARRSTREDPIAKIGDVLEGQNNLLILDNLEHIVDEAAPIVGKLIESVAGLICLVTSRQSLKVQAEHEMAIQPLPVPDKAVEGLPLLAGFPSIQLFIDRCQAIRPDFQLTTHNAPSVAAICAKLEGIPLAIEIAAGLTSTFGPTQMVRHLERRLTSLTSRRRDVPQRHQSLRAAIDYSYDSLSPELQQFFVGLSAFRGGFSIEAAYEVCFRWLDRPGDRAETLERKHPHELCLSLLLDLHERSLLRSDDEQEQADARFGMLESFREYGDERLSEAGRQALRTRHAHYFLGDASLNGMVFSADERAQNHIRIEADYENRVAALEFCLEERDIQACVKLLSILSTTWLTRGPRMIERQFIRQIVAAPEFPSIDPSSRILLLRMLGTTYIRDSDYVAAYRACSDALEIALSTEDSELIATCYSGMSICAGYMGRMQECLELNLRALQLSREDNWALRERSYIGIGAVHWGRGELCESEEAVLRARELSERVRGGEPDALILNNLARICFDQGRLEEGMRIMEQSIRICQRLHDEFTLSMCLCLVARYHWLSGNLSAAIATSHEALLKGREAAFSFWSLYGIREHALILVDMGELEVATVLMGATQSIEKMNRVMDDREYASAKAKIRRTLSASNFERAWAKGLAMNSDDAFQLALRYK